MKRNSFENKDDELFNAIMKLYQTLKHPCYNQRNMAKHILIKSKGLRKTLLVLEKQDQMDKLLFSRTTLKSISYLRKKIQKLKKCMQMIKHFKTNFHQ